MKDLTSGQAAKLCQVAPRTVCKWCDSGRLKSYKFPLSGDRRIAPADLRAFLKRHRMPVPRELIEVELVSFGLQTPLGEAHECPFELAVFCSRTTVGAARIGDTCGLQHALDVLTFLRNNGVDDLTLVLSAGTTLDSDPKGVKVVRCG